MNKLISLVLSASLLSGCATYKKPTSSYGPKLDDSHYEIREKAVQSPIYDIVPRHREQIKPFDFAHWTTWALMGNDGDGIFGEYSGKNPYTTNINFKGFCSWNARNPMHNLTFYVIGSANWKKHYNFSLISTEKDKGIEVLSNASKWKKGTKKTFDIGFNDFKPYLKIAPPKVDVFLGWRRNGSFEIKARPDLEKKPKKK